MAILGALIKKGIELKKSIDKPKGSPAQLQLRTLSKLLEKAQYTQVGKAYHFNMVLGAIKSNDPVNLYRQFVRNVPTFSYNEIFNLWWHKTLKGEANVAWPGRIKYFALSSGTSESTSKYIPITKELVKSNQKTSIRQILTLSYLDLPTDFFLKGILMLGGSTKLKYNGTYYEGDLSGIQASLIPYWFQPFYKPGRKISKNTDWNEKLDDITRQARNWDIGVVAGVPAWIQILIEKIIDYYGVKTIHDIWPNFRLYSHGGVSFEPYRKSFEKLVAHPLICLETYLASEGFIAYQAEPNSKGMKLSLDNGIFMEFVPFNEVNFNEHGDMVKNPEALMIHQVNDYTDYALLISTCAGAWRYLIGDVIRFTDVAKAEIIIRGRTKHYISLCGEHLSVENMNKAIAYVAEEMNISIPEFTVAGVPSGTLFGHKWFIGAENTEDINADRLIQMLDNKLKELNDDYKVERSAALTKVYGEVLPLDVFYDFMRLKGKEGGQNKFPRVLKNSQLEEWEKFLKSKSA